MTPPVSPSPSKRKDKGKGRAEPTPSPTTSDIMMAMSTDTSPQHAGHMPPAFHTAPMQHHPGHPGPQHLPPNPYHDSSALPGKDDPLAQPPGDHQHPGGPPPPHANGNGSAPNPAPSKGKNGATGPADGKTKPHICQICKRGFTTGGHLQRHQRIHTGVKAFRCPFPGCETRTSRQDNLQQQYVCPASCKTFYAHRSLMSQLPDTFVANVAERFRFSSSCRRQRGDGGGRTQVDVNPRTP